MGTRHGSKGHTTQQVGVRVVGDTPDGVDLQLWPRASFQAPLLSSDFLSSAYAVLQTPVSEPSPYSLASRWSADLLNDRQGHLPLVYVLHLILFTRACESVGMVTGDGMATAVCGWRVRLCEARGEAPSGTENVTPVS